MQNEEMWELIKIVDESPLMMDTIHQFVSNELTTTVICYNILWNQIMAQFE